MQFGNRRFEPALAKINYRQFDGGVGFLRSQPTRFPKFDSRLIKSTGGNQTRAALRLGISRKSLLYRLAQLGIRRDSESRDP